MANTRFSGPVNSDNGFSGTVLTVASATITNLVSTSLTIGTTKLTSGSAVSGLVSAQLGYIPVMVGSTTAYIGLYRSITL
jgi:hypothetical protein